MVIGRTPWESSNEKELREKLKSELVLPESIKNPQVREFIFKCCQLNETKRMSRDELSSYIFKLEEAFHDKPSAITAKKKEGTAEKQI